MTDAVLITNDQAGSNPAVFGFLGGTVAISPSGTYMAASQNQSSTGTDTVYRSSDGGLTWSNIGTPSGSWTTGAVAVYDNGTVHYLAYDGTDLQHSAYSGSWSTPVHTNALSYAFASFVDYTNSLLVAVLANNFANSSLYTSSDDGATWTRRGSFAGIGAGYSNTHLAAGGYVHYAISTGGNYQYQRFNTSTLTIDVTGHPFTNDTTNYFGPVFLNAPGSTSTIWAVEMSVSLATVKFYESTDSGSTWSSVVWSVSPPSLNGNSPATQGIAMGADGKVTMYSVADASHHVWAAAFDLTAGTWGSDAVVPGTVNGSDTWCHVAQRSDATQQGPFIFMQTEITGGVTSPCDFYILFAPSLTGWSVGFIRIG